MKQNASLLSGTLLIAGTSIGAGILALPIISAPFGFLLSTFFLIFLWSVMLLSAHYTIELNLNAAKRVTIPKLMEKHFGLPGGVFAKISLLLLFYALLSAYISGASSLLSIYIPFKTDQLALLFTLFLGALVTFHLRAVDLGNRFLFIFKTCAFFTIILILLPQINSLKFLKNMHWAPIYLTKLLPIFFTAFGFHGSLPVLVHYMGNNKKRIHQAVFWGSLIPLLAYIAWEFMIFGLVPETGTYSLKTLQAEQDGLKALMLILGHHVHSSYLATFLNLFSLLAIATSFLGVAISLFDYLTEHFETKKQRPNRLFISGLTFILPLLIAIFNPQIFVTALGYAAIALSLLAIIFPILLSFKLKRIHNRKKLALLLFTIGSVIILLEVYTKF